MKVIGFYITDANALQEAELSSEFLKKDKSDRDKVLDAIIKKVEDLKKGIASKTNPTNR